MTRHILTGAPGAGKTTLIRLLAAEGHTVVEEAATDLIEHAQAHGDAEPWTSPSFIDAIVALQHERQVRAGADTGTQFFDRSPLCTYALCLFLGHSPTAALMRELERIEQENIYERRVLFVQNLGFCTPTPVRRISFEDTLRFETAHADAYRQFGYECVPIAPRPPPERLEFLKLALG